MAKLISMLILSWGARPESEDEGYRVDVIAHILKELR